LDWGRDVGDEHVRELAFIRPWLDDLERLTGFLELTWRQSHQRSQLAGGNLGQRNVADSDTFSRLVHAPRKPNRFIEGTISRECGTGRHAHHALVPSGVLVKQLDLTLDSPTGEPGDDDEDASEQGKG
jgi:hypothetical protein